MNYIVVLFVFLINYLVWKYLLNKLMQRVSKRASKVYFSLASKVYFPLDIFFASCIFLFIPYGISLMILNYFDLSNNLHVLTFILLSLFSFRIYKNLKSEQAQRHNCKIKTK